MHLSLLDVCSMKWDRTSFFKAQDVFVRCLLFWFSITWRLLLLHSWSPPHVVLFEKRPAPCCPVMQNCKCHATKTRIYPSRPNLSLLNRGHRSIIEDLTSRRFTLSLFLLLSPPHPTRSLVVACVNLKSEVMAESHLTYWRDPFLGWNSHNTGDHLVLMQEQLHRVHSCSSTFDMVMISPCYSVLVLRFGILPFVLEFVFFPFKMFKD